MFDPDKFVADCQAALKTDASQSAIQEMLGKALENPAAVVAGLGVPEKAGVTVLHHADDLTILNLVWGPHMTIMPHNHQMWAVIGIYGGREDNIFWRRRSDDPTGRVEAAGAKALSTGDCVPLGSEIIHSVTNPIKQFSGALHVYGGDFFGVERSEWDAEILNEKPYDVKKNIGMFEESNQQLNLG